MRIRDVISANAGGALEVHDLKTRIAGRVTFIEFHLVVEANMSVRRCTRHLRPYRKRPDGRDPERVRHIHVEPEDEAKLPLGTGAVPFA